MSIHTQQGRVEKQGSVVTIRLSWKSTEDLPSVDGTEQYPVYATLTGDREAGPPASDAVNQKWLGRVSAIDAEKHEVTIVTPYHAKEVVPAAAAIDVAELGYFVFQGNKALLYNSAVHDPSCIAGMVISPADNPDDDVWILRK